jgi:hypothetical protein
LWNDYSKQFSIGEIHVGTLASPNQKLFSHRDDTAIPDDKV